MADSESPDTSTAVPRALKIVALLFAFGGALSVLTMLLNYFEGIARMDFGIVKFWMSAGLLRLDRKWLKWSKRFIWFDLIMIDIVSLFLTLNRTDPKIKFGPIPMNFSNMEAILLFLGVAGLSLWQLRVLSRPEIDELFQERAASAAIPNRKFAPVRELSAPMPITESQPPVAGATRGVPRESTMGDLPVNRTPNSLDVG